MITINRAEKGSATEPPEGFYFRSQVSRLTGISMSTLIRWHADSIFMPQTSTERGSVKVWLYSEAQVEDLLQSPPYQKLGRPPKTKDVKA